MKNSYELDGEVVRIKMFRKNEAFYSVIDLSDLPLVDSIRGTWYPNPARAPKGKYYVCAKAIRTIMMHRIIMGDPKHEVHHRDNDGLNNRRSNLEVVTHIKNLRARQPDRDWAAFDVQRAAKEQHRQELAKAREMRIATGLSRQTIWYRMNRKRVEPADSAERSSVRHIPCPVCGAVRCTTPH